MQFLTNFMTSLLNWFYQLTTQIGWPSYGLAIILFTIVIKVLLYPLTLKQMKSIKMTQLLQPKVKEIQEKYKNDPQKAQIAIMELYKEHGANPLAGCLPILIQFPIFIALFNALRDFKYLNAVHANFLWVHLSSKDPYFILPVIAAAATFVQQKMSMSMNTSTDPAQESMQKTMLYVMPIMFGWFATQVPSGLALYWVVFNLVGIVQQYFINRQTVVLKEDSVGEERVHQKRKNR